MRWKCDRCGSGLSTKDYDSPDDARRYAAAFNRRDSDALGKRAPLLGLLALRLWCSFARRR